MSITSVCLTKLRHGVPIPMLAFSQVLILVQIATIPWTDPNTGMPVSILSTECVTIAVQVKSLSVQ